MEPKWVFGKMKNVNKTVRQFWQFFNKTKCQKANLTDFISSKTDYYFTTNIKRSGFDLCV